MKQKVSLRDLYEAVREAEEAVTAAVKALRKAEHSESRARLNLSKLESEDEELL
jgi:hypothetical protein